jgi:uncharacterized protein YgbK (DUF1537 family)
VTRVLLPQCNRSWIVQVPPGFDGPALRSALPRLLGRVESEGVSAIHPETIRALTPALRAALEASEVTSADAVDIDAAHDEKPTAHLVLLPAHRR